MQILTQKSAVVALNSSTTMYRENDGINRNDPIKPENYLDWVPEECCYGEKYLMEVISAEGSVKMNVDDDDDDDDDKDDDKDVEDVEDDEDYEDNEDYEKDRDYEDDYEDGEEDEEYEGANTIDTRQLKDLTKKLIGEYSLDEMVIFENLQHKVVT